MPFLPKILEKECYLTPAMAVVCHLCFSSIYGRNSPCVTVVLTSFVAVDCADITRLGTFASKFSKCKNTYSIDHHVSNDHFAKTNYVCDSASNCENIYQLLQVANVKIDKEIANFLAMGIMTDTGGFRHKNVTPTTLSIASSLAGKGADLNKISYYMFTMQSKERALLFSKAMSSIRYFHGDKVAIAVVEYKDFLSTVDKN